MKRYLKIAGVAVAVIIAAIGLVVATTDTTVLRVSKNQASRDTLIWVEATALINAPPSVVWQLVGEDFDKNGLFVYNVETSGYLDKKPGMVGTIRTNTETSGATVDVEIIEFDTEKMFVEWEIIRVDGPIETGIASYSVAAVGDKSQLTFRGGFRMEYFFMDWMGKSKFPGGFRAIVAGVKLRVEQDKKLSEDGIEAIFAEYGDQVQARILP